MKNINILFSAFMIAAVLLVPANIANAATVETFSQTVAAAAGGSVVIEKFSGDISIKGTSKNELSVSVELQVKNGSDKLAQEFIDSSSLEVTKTSNGYTVKFDTPMLSDDTTVPEAFVRNFKTLFRGGTWQISSSQKMVLRLPSEYSVTAKNSYGDLKMDDVFGTHNLRNSSGEIHVTNCGGRLLAQNSYALAAVSNFDGSIDIHSSSGEIKAINIDGDAQLANSYRAVTFENIDGDCVVKSSSAPVRGQHVGGDCEIKTSYKKVDISDVKGDLTIHASSADVTAHHIAGLTYIESSYNPVVVDSIGGRLTVTSSSAPVTATRIGGDTEIRTSYKPIKIKDVNGSLVVEGSSCSVEALSINGDVSLSATYHDIIAKNIEGRLEIHASSAPVTVENIKKSAFIKSTYKAISISNVRGDIEVDGSSCSVTAQDIGGDINVSNTYKYVVLSGTRGSVTVHGSSSPIDVDIEELSAADHVELTTTYKQIKINLPHRANAQFDATGEHIEIENIKNVQPNSFKAEEIEFNQAESKITAKGRLNLDIGDGESSIFVKTGGKVLVTQK
jgi:hypothetical protein